MISKYLVGKVVLAVEKAEAGKLVQYRRPQDNEYVPISQILDSHWRKRLNGLGKRKLARIGRYRNQLLKYYATSANRKDRHHIFPRSIMRGLDESPNRYNSIANICLLTAEENKQIGSKQPRKYLGHARSDTKYFRKKMNRHLIPCDDVGEFGSEMSELALIDSEANV